MTRTRNMADKALPDQPVESPKLNNTSLQLSTDLDTHITSDTDNRMDFAVGGSDVVHIHPNIVQITSASDGASSQTDLQIIQTTTSPASDDYGGMISFYHENDANESIFYSSLRSKNADYSDGSEDGKIEVHLMLNGTHTACYGLDNDKLRLLNSPTLFWENFTSTHDGTLTPATLTSARTWTLPDATGTVLLSDGDGSNLTGIDALPSQSSHSGKFLTTDGSSASWATVDALPSQSSHSGKYLTTNGSTASWGTITSGISNVVEDTSPQLGGTLDANSQSIDMGTNLITDAKVGQWDSAYGWGNHASGGYLTTSSASSTYAPLAGASFTGNVSVNDSELTVDAGSSSNTDENAWINIKPKGYYYGGLNFYSQTGHIGSIFGHHDNAQKELRIFMAGSSIGSNSVISGTQALRIKSDGVVAFKEKVGINQDSPSLRLVVEEDADDWVASFNQLRSSGGYGLRVDNSNAGNNADTRYALAVYTPLNMGLCVRNNATVGIGESSPDTPLHITGTDPIVKLEASGNNDRGIRLYGGATEKASILWNEGNANFWFKNYRTDANISYANIGFFTGGGTSTTPALRMNINYAGAIGFTQSGNTTSTNQDPNNMEYGSSGQVLTSNGNLSPPTWQTAASGGLSAGKSIVLGMAFG